MNVKEWIDEIEWEGAQMSLEVPDRRVLLRWVSTELAVLSGKLDSDIFTMHLDPAIITRTGTRYYDLPDNFGLNFCRNGDNWVCRLNNGSNELQLDYVSNTEFFNSDLEGESNGTPSKYTVLSKPNGRKQIALSPPPDSNSDSHYTIDGLYIPTDWKLRDEDTVPPLPANSPILKYAVLRRLNRNYDADYREALVDLKRHIAQNRNSGFGVDTGELGQGYYGRM